LWQLGTAGVRIGEVTALAPNLPRVRSPGAPNAHRDGASGPVTGQRSPEAETGDQAATARIV
jgi:hypothetical protein